LNSNRGSFGIRKNIHDQLSQEFDVAGNDLKTGSADEPSGKNPSLFTYSIIWFIGFSVLYLAAGKQRPETGLL
jgi:hypothetical protein